MKQWIEFQSSEIEKAKSIRVHLGEQAAIWVNNGSSMATFELWELKAICEQIISTIDKRIETDNL